jgi:hypothetical protein
MEEPSGLAMVYQGDTEAKRELVFVYGKFVPHLMTIIPLVASLGKDLYENKLTEGETRARLIALVDQIEFLLTLL